MFVFCVVTVNDEHKKPRLIRRRRGLKYRGHIRRISFQALWQNKVVR